MSEEIIVICVTADQKTPFIDNLIGTCFRCGVAVQYRPHVPAGAKFCCQGCWLRDPPPGEPSVTRETLIEAALVLGGDDGKKPS
jgi:hypothetical protein